MNRYLLKFIKLNNRSVNLLMLDMKIISSFYQIEDVQRGLNIHFQSEAVFNIFMWTNITQNRRMNPLTHYYRLKINLSQFKK